MKNEPRFEDKGLRCWSKFRVIVLETDVAFSVVRCHVGSGEESLTGGGPLPDSTDQQLTG